MYICIISIIITRTTITIHIIITITLMINTTTHGLFIIVAMIILLPPLAINYCRIDVAE